MELPGKDEIERAARDVLREVLEGARPAAPPRAGNAGASGGGGPAPARQVRVLVDQSAVRAAKDKGLDHLDVPLGSIVTPLAHDLALDLGVAIRFPVPAAETAPRGEALEDGGPAPRASGLKLAFGADHGGFELKQALVAHARGLGLDVLDLGTHTKDACDYPDLAAAVARAVALGEAGWGVLIDGAGIGSCMAANKVPGVLAATCHDERTARNSREHNGANVLCLGSGSLERAAAIRVVEAWLATPFAGGRHGKRVKKIRALEKSFSR